MYEEDEKVEKGKRKEGRGTAGSHIGSNHNRTLAGFEFTKNPISFSLLFVAMNC